MGIFNSGQSSIVPIVLSVKAVTILTAGSPADIATISVPAGITRYRVLGAGANAQPAFSIIPKTFTATQAAAAFTMFDGAGGTGNNLTGSVSGITTVGTQQSLGPVAANNVYSTSATIYIRQTANSANAGVDDFYVVICPMN